MLFIVESSGEKHILLSARFGQIQNKKVELIFLFMDDGSITMLVALIVLVCLSAFFSASETAFSSLNLIRLKSRAEDGEDDAKRVLALAEQYDNVLSTILIGNNIVNIAAASLATILFTRYVSAEYGAPLSTVVLTIVVLVFGEITPKSLAKECPERFATVVAPILQILMVICAPLNWLFACWKKLLGRHFHTEDDDVITEGELITMVSEAESDGELTDRESELIRSAIEFDDVEVEEVLTPRVDVAAVSDTISMDDLADAFAHTGYSRLPVYHETIDNIIGVVHEKDYYIARRKGTDNIEQLITPTLYTTGSTQISTLLRTLREQHHHLAVVVDEYGGTEGIITLEDILEELVGEIWDEHDEVVEDFRLQSDGTWLVSGAASVDDLFEHLDIPEDTDIDSNTVSGLVQEKTAHLPKVGDRFTLDGFEGTVTRTAHRRVTEVRLRPVAALRKSETER
jgi:CBS domain containing-hemolysin-like protein